ncbi:MAG TPA: hypothetical protein VLM36_01470 [Sphingomicrobium sp.]|jgi:hypothetical protein|nr:hypothetical protein [Sphingomicrobium sp.]
MNEPLERLRLNATKCRDLASDAITPAARDVLTALAEQYEQRATSLAHSHPLSHRRPAFKWPLA